MNTEVKEQVEEQEEKEEFVDLFQVKEDEGIKVNEQGEVAPQEPVTPLATESSKEVDPKYKDKSIEDVIEMHLNAQSELSRQYNRTNKLEEEVKKLTSLSEGLIDRKLGGNGESEVQEVDADALLENPKEVILKVLSEHPELVNVVEANRQMQRNNAERDFLSRHPDAGELTKTPLFEKWITSNADRQDKFANVYSTGDFGGALQIYDEFKVTYEDQLKDFGTKKETEDSVAKGLSGASGTTKRSAGSKMIDQEQVFELLRENPDRYEKLMQPGGYLQVAFEEGRVKMRGT